MPSGLLASRFTGKLRLVETARQAEDRACRWARRQPARQSGFGDRETDSLANGHPVFLVGLTSNSRQSGTRGIAEEGRNESKRERVARFACTSSPSSVDSLDFPLRFRSLSLSLSLFFSFFISAADARIFPQYNLSFYVKTGETATTPV